ncbi:phosphotransferase enzyme family protein [Histoplasma capsulatum var. duboisii H88]|uniref:Altered inheritance of mitochondria protein 9, mitochondrial n=1 Tax=Ajellomyces capsulatus (strain H88) TaxID=544711 RepID=A0A8A1LGJ6_AJEC8|nr:phosphotransferase enzyme family protein [Histoplasma capsulatum var. duboisii H88]
MITFQFAGPNGYLDVRWDDDSFYHYTGGRWLFNEAEQLADRCVKFNMAELVRLATKSLGCSPSSCVSVEKLPEGNYNKAFLIKMCDGRQVVAKVPNPNAGLPFYTTASEVATMDFVRTIAGIPSPKVYAWNARATGNPVGAEYIVMDKADGVLLSSKWPTMSMKEKHQLTQVIIDFERSLLSHHFENIGSLYYETDLAGLQDKFSTTGYSGFAIGPTTNRQVLEDGRKNFDSDKGPWSTASEYILASARRERECIQRSAKFPRPEGIFGGPRSYEPTADAKLAVLDNFEKVAPYLLPKDTSVNIPVLWHSDLHHDNIFVDSADPSKVLSIIDWQSVYLAPLFQQATTPAFLDFDGPKQMEGLSVPSLPNNFGELSLVEKERAKTLLAQQSLYKLYEIQSARQNPPVFKALRNASTLGSQIISLVSQVFNDGESIVNGQLIQVAREWDQIVGKDGPSCPLTATPAEIAAQDVNQRKWEEGVQLMEDVLEALGGSENGWQGWVSHEDYSQMKGKLSIVRKQFLDHMAENEEEREAWDRVWPFQNK